MVELTREQMFEDVTFAFARQRSEVRTATGEFSVNLIELLFGLLSDKDTVQIV